MGSAKHKGEGGRQEFKVLPEKGVGDVTVE